MTKEKLIEIVNACVQYNANQGTWFIDNRFTDELLTLIEQEKKEQAREILEEVFAPYNDIGGGLYELTPKDKRILTKKYGVKL